MLRDSCVGTDLMELRRMLEKNLLIEILRFTQQLSFFKHFSGISPNYSNKKLCLLFWNQQSKDISSSAKQQKQILIKIRQFYFYSSKVQCEH